MLVRLFFLFFAASCSASEYSINVAETTVTAERKQLLETFFNRIYEPLGIKPEFYYLPSKRGLELVNAGEIDAEAGRFEQIARQYENLIKIETPVAIIRSILFCVSQQHCVNSDESAIGIQTGFESAKQFCLELKGECLFDNSPKILARSMDSGVLTSLLLAQDEAAQVICELSTKQIYYSNMPQFDQYTFHLVNKKHSNLIPAINQSIRVLTRSEWVASLQNNWLVKLAECDKSIININEMQ